MTRILLHPTLLPRTGMSRVALPTPWSWWRLRLVPSPDGYLVHQSYDDPTNVREVCFMFDLLEDVEIHDPPAFHLRHYVPEYDDFNDRYGDTRRVVRASDDGEVEVVWHKRPGPRWEQLPGNTCCPGDYQASTGDPREMRRCEDAGQMVYMPNMPTLLWDEVATDAASALGRQLMASFSVPGAQIERQPRTLDEHCQDIWDAMRTYESQMAQRPSVVLMNERDYRELQRLATQDELNRGLYEHSALTRRPYDSIMGLEIRTERAVAPGTYVVVGERTGYEPLAQNGVSGYTAQDVQSMRSGFVGPLGQMGILSPREVREIERRPTPPMASSVLPEAELIDEIDRLVNDSIRPGPRDDYNVDRYVKCKECFHDWHGLECEASRCDCINTDWLTQ